MEGEKTKNGVPDEAGTVRFGSFLFIPQRHELRKGGMRITMSASQTRLLHLFTERPDEVITRDEIAARLWVDSRTVDVATGINTAINRLRHHLREAPKSASRIETVIGLGYRFVSDGNGPEPLLIEKQAIPPPESTGAGVNGSETAEPHFVEPRGEDVSSLEVGFPEAGQQWHPQQMPTASRPEQMAAARLRPALWALGILLLGATVLLGLHLWAVRRSQRSPVDSSAFAPVGTEPMIRVTSEEDAGTVTAAAVAPSGQSAAYADRFGVSVHWFTGRAERLLGVQPSFLVDRLSWLPDESGLLMSGTDKASQRQQVWVVPLQGAYLRLLADDADDAAASPDGSRMVFTRKDGQELWTAAADGQNPRRLREAEVGESFNLLLWSPAGNRLILTMRKGLKARDSAVLADAPGQGAYECIDADSGRLLDREEGISAESGFLLADGRFFFVENRTPGPTTGASGLMMVSIDLASGRLRGAPTRIRSFDARSAISLTASSNGSRLVSVLNRVEADVFTADMHPGPELSNVLRLTRGLRQTYPHAWTADGKSVIFESDALTPSDSRAKWALYDQPLDAPAAHLLVSLPDSAAMPQLSPDGHWILFLEFTGFPQHAIGVFRVPAAGGQVEQVPTHGDIEEFHCSNSAAGRCVLRETVGNEQLVYYALDPIHGMGQELARTPWQPNRLGDWGLSGDGVTVATANHDAAHPGVSLFALGSGPVKMREIALRQHGTTLGANWAPDGKSVFVGCKTERGFELVNLDLAGHVKLLRASPNLIWAVLSRDARKIAFPGLFMSSSVWTSTATP